MRRASRSYPERTFPNQTRHILKIDGAKTVENWHYLFPIDRWKRHSRDIIGDGTRGAESRGSFLQLCQTGASRPNGATNSLPRGCRGQAQRVSVSRLYLALGCEDGGCRPGGVP